MSDEQYPDVIDRAFDSFRTGGPLAVPLGPDAVRRTVKHRAKVRTMTGVALAALVVIAPTAVYASGALDSNAPPQVGTSASPSPGDSPTPTSTPSSTPSSPPSSTGQAPPDSRISDPGNATLPLPTWSTAGAGAIYANLPYGDTPTPKPCPTGPTTFFNGTASAPASAPVTVLKSVEVDVNGDGAPETVVVLTCNMYTLPIRMVVAFDKDASGRIVLFGTVLQASFGTSKPEVLDDLQSAAGGVVRVHVGDRYVCCTQPMTTNTQFQWRGYAWNGTAFAQSTGPTAFPPLDPKKVDLGMFGPETITMSRVAPGDDTVTGTLTFNVINYGPGSANPYGRYIISTHRQGYIDAPPAGCQPMTDPLYAYLCPLTIAPGQTKTVTVTIRGSRAALAGGDSYELMVGAADSLTAWPGFDPFVQHDAPPHLTTKDVAVVLSD